MSSVLRVHLGRELVLARSRVRSFSVVCERMRSQSVSLGGRLRTGAAFASTRPDSAVKFQAVAVARARDAEGSGYALGHHAQKSSAHC